ncbi:MAG: HTH domain-containing protein [Bacteroidales bacterium]|nr:HTH domain-containing protein [Bacteroidales bacterium]
MTLSKALNILRYIDYCIKSEKSIKAAEIAEKLEISERQVFNYLKEMKTEGFPIAYSRKTNKFYYTEEGFFFLGFLKTGIQN